MKHAATLLALTLILPAFGQEAGALDFGRPRTLQDVARELKLKKVQKAGSVSQMESTIDQSGFPAAPVIPDVERPAPYVEPQIVEREVPVPVVIGGGYHGGPYHNRQRTRLVASPRAPITSPRGPIVSPRPVVVAPAAPRVSTFTSGGRNVGESLRKR